MNNSIKKTQDKYSNFIDTYNYSFVGFPKGFGGIKKAFYGSFNEFKKKYPNIHEKKRYKILLYIHGSSGLSKGTLYRKYIVEELDFIFFAPNSHKLKNRPSYKTPATQNSYIKVHKVRIAEID